MKLNKSLIIAALVAGNLIAWDTVRAQDSKTNTPSAGAPGARRGMAPNIDQLAKQLDLTEDQKPKVKDVLDAQQEKIRALRTDTALTPEDRRAKMKTIRDDSTAKMKEILTADQFDKYTKMMAAGRNRPGGPGGAGAPPATPPPAGGK